MNNTKDIAIASTSTLPVSGSLPLKPIYLLKIKEDKKVKLFIAIDTPVSNNNFLHTKGAFFEGSEEELIDNYRSIVANTDPAQILEMWFPAHLILNVRSLVFRYTVKK